MQSIKEEAKPVPEDTEEPPEQGSKRPPSKRPALVKQKHSFPFPALQEEELSPSFEDSQVVEKLSGPSEEFSTPPPLEKANPFDQKKSFEDIKEEVKSMPRFSFSDRRKSSSDDPGGGGGGNSARTSLSLDEAADEYGDLPTIVSSLSRSMYK